MALRAYKGQAVFVDDAVIVRKRVLGALDRAARRPIVLVAAPAGYGKSVLLRQWIESRATGVVQVDADAPDAWSVARRALERGRTVVVDDCHRNGWGDDFLAACEAASTQAPLVVATRVDPLVALHGQRLSGRVSELRADDLAFTVGELVRVVARTGRRLNPEEAHSLYVETDGWPAGVRLGAGRVRRSTVDIGAFSPTGSYLVAQVLDSLDHDLRDFLRMTAVPERFDVALAVRLAGRADAGAVLDEVAHRVGFVSRDDESGIYHYHHLLRQVLLDELTRETPDVVRALHRETARWYAEKSEHAPSGRHAVEAHDWDLAADDAVALACVAVGDGSWAAVDSLVAAIPHAVGTDDSRLHLVAAARALGTVEADTVVADDELNHVHGPVSASIVATRHADALARLCRARLALTADRIEDVGPALGTPQPVLSEHDSLPRSPAAALRAAWAVTNGLVAAFAGAPEDAAAHLATARRVGVGLPGIVTASAEVEAWVSWGAGDLAGAAAAIADQPSAGDDDLPDSVLLVRGWVAFERDEYDPSSDAGLHGPHRAGAHAGVLPRREVDAARQALLTRTGTAAPQVVSANAEAQHSRLVARHARLSHEIALLGSGDVRAAAAALADHLDALPTPAPDIEVRLHLAHAVLAHRTEDATAASTAMRRALASTEQHGWRRAWRELGATAVELLSAERQRVGRHADLVARLLVDLRGEHRRDSVGLVVALSVREDEILQYLPGTLDQAEICAALFISRNTLKTHLRAIYRKLGVESRREAVLKAEAIGLL
ncbi:LuxR C-terminal-related transcriptional regulator [Mumia qirimensis]|uniref:LuxR C-terminal-related transcriptional regulator n=1 Tax=Mumia qirimensis TaxID=3234852 RepID=UPI00351D6EE2